MTDAIPLPAAPLPEQEKAPLVTGSYQTDAQKKAEADKLAAEAVPAKV